MFLNTGANGALYSPSGSPTTKPDQYNQNAAGVMKTARAQPVTWAANIERGLDKVCKQKQSLL